MTAVAIAPDVRVQVWFGTHLISDWTGPADLGERLATQQQRRFSSNCTITVEPVHGGVEWPALRPSDPDPCDGTNPATGSPCILGHHNGYHRDSSGAEWLDD